MNTALVLFSVISFLGYGSGCFFSAHLKEEFIRYGFGAYRALTGVLQICAALGLFIGLYQPWLGRLAAGGLALMMLVAVGVRIKIKDNFKQTVPALFYFLVNAYLAWRGF